MVKFKDISTKMTIWINLEFIIQRNLSLRHKIGNPGELLLVTYDLYTYMFV